jgi:hypothetical protein
VFFASTRDQCIFGEPTLAALLALIQDVCDCAEDDVVVWHRNLIVAVYADRRFTWLRPEFKPAAVAA